MVLISEQLPAPIETNVRLINPRKPTFIRVKHGLAKVDLDKLQYVQACGDYCNLYFDGKRYTVHTSLSRLEHRLPDWFYRNHRSYIVNVRLIEKLEQGPGCTVYIDGHPLPVGDMFVSGLKKRVEII